MFEHHLETEGYRILRRERAIATNLGIHKSKLCGRPTPVTTLQESRSGGIDIWQHPDRVDRPIDTDERGHQSRHISLFDIPTVNIRSNPKEGNTHREEGLESGSGALIPFPQVMRGVRVLSGSKELGYKLIEREPTRLSVACGNGCFSVPPSPWFPILDIP